MASDRTSRAVTIVALALAGCSSAAVGDPCEDGDECGAGLVCFQPEGSSPTCTEPPAECEDQENELCGCEALIALCELGHACVGFGDVTTLSCTE